MLYIQRGSQDSSRVMTQESITSVFGSLISACGFQVTLAGEESENKTHTFS